MSPRTITAGYTTEMNADTSEFVHLIKLAFSGGTVFITTAAQDIVWSGNTYQAVGGNLQVGAVEESIDTSGQGVELTLSGVDTTILATLLSNDFRGRVAQVYRAHLNTSTGAVVVDPQLLFEGLQLSAYEVEEVRDPQRKGGTVTIKTRIKGRMGIDRVRGIFSSVVSHSHIFPGDTFWQNAAPLVTATIYWGNAAPMTPGGGGIGPGNPNPQGQS